MNLVLEHKKGIIKSYEDNISITEIARREHVSAPIIYKYLDRWGIKKVEKRTWAKPRREYYRRKY